MTEWTPRLITDALVNGYGLDMSIPRSTLAGYLWYHERLNRRECQSVFKYCFHANILAYDGRKRIRFHPSFLAQRKQEAATA